MAILIPKSSSGTPLLFFMVLSSDHISALTGASPTVTISKNGGAFAAPSGAVSEIANGWYQVAGNATDTGTAGPIALHATAASGDPSDMMAWQVVDTTVALIGTNVVSVAAAASNIKKNTALNAFGFLMVDTNFVPKTGLTVTATRSLDGAAFAPCANAVSEVGFGIYSINLAAGDLNANVVVLRFTAAGASDQDITIITQP